jgi:hypothetical protein
MRYFRSAIQLLKTHAAHSDQPQHIGVDGESYKSHPVQQIGMFPIRTLGASTSLVYVRGNGNRMMISG